MIIIPHTSTIPRSTLSLHDALPIFADGPCLFVGIPGSMHRHLGVVRVGPVREQRFAQAPFIVGDEVRGRAENMGGGADRKSTRLDSSHVKISYAVVCL